MKAMMGRGKDLAARLSPLQKIALGAVTMTMVAGAFVLSRAGSAPAMSALYTDLDSSDASAVVDQLASRGVSYSLTDAGHTVLVPQSQVYDLRIALAGAGLPASNEGYALLDNQGITTSEFRQRIDYQRALEGELTMTLKAMDGVQTASVHLALPEESVFVDTPADPTASVMISTGSAGEVSDDQVQAITHLVSSAVKNMKPEDVTVIDADGTVLSAPGIAGSTGGATARTKAQTAYEQRVAASISAMLARTTGAQNVAVTVTAELDLDAKQSTIDDYGSIGTDTAGGQVVSDSGQIELYGDAAAQGAAGSLGVGGVTIATAVPTSVAAGGYASASSDKAYVIDRVVQQVTNAPGLVVKMSVAVLLDDKAVSAAQVADIEKLVTAAAGIDDARGDSLVVTRLPFNTAAADEAAKVVAADTAETAAARQMELIRTLAVAFVILIAVILAYRSTRKARKITATPIDIGEITAAGDASEDSMSAGALGAAGSGPLGDTSGRSIGAGMLHNGLMLQLEQNDSPMAEIAEIAESRPEEVANVLRAWLAESKAGRR